MRRLRRGLQRTERRAGEVPVAASTAIGPNHSELHGRSIASAQRQAAHRDAREDLVALLVPDARNRCDLCVERLRELELEFQFVADTIELVFELARAARVPTAARHISARLLAPAILTHLHRAHSWWSGRLTPR